MSLPCQWFSLACLGFCVVVSRHCKEAAIANHCVPSSIKVVGLSIRGLCLFVVLSACKHTRMSLCRWSRACCTVLVGLVVTVFHALLCSCSRVCVTAHRTSQHQAHRPFPQRREKESRRCSACSMHACNCCCEGVVVHNTYGKVFRHSFAFMLGRENAMQEAAWTGMRG